MQSNILIHRMQSILECCSVPKTSQGGLSPANPSKPAICPRRGAVAYRSAGQGCRVTDICRVYLRAQESSQCDTLGRSQRKICFSPHRVRSQILKIYMASFQLEQLKLNRLNRLLDEIKGVLGKV